MGHHLFVTVISGIKTRVKNLAKYCLSCGTLTHMLCGHKHKTFFTTYILCVHSVFRERMADIYEEKIFSRG